ncbi:hypothetical protein K503DRAFT_121032 [Rhizopogon vinicolor AM-OR11-026]|uniref:Uncharacterized protein n=1 Tax=Rhizopogon vinicolor AM-OR11-026 TaxID=1314800 RepID=A0A1B7N264_9AGAM|nr:hypothetical protein K503DRAFT_121032 [Rhizopogon vinicolor AM-OR11-026]
MQEVCCRKLSSALLPYGAERLIRSGIFHPATTPLCCPYLPGLGSHGCLQFFLTQMPVFCYHGCLQILLMQKEVILLTQFIGPSFYFLTSMRCWAYFPAPTILGIRGSLRCAISLLISWESQLTSAHPHTGRGRYRGLRPNSYLHLTNANILSLNAA